MDREAAPPGRIILLTICLTAAAPAAAQDEGQGGAVLLDTIEVQAAAGATEGSGSWVAPNASGAATGLPLTPFETPQSVSVITNAQIQAQNAQTLAQALDYATGVFVSQGNGDYRYGYYARGQEIINLQYDGVPTFTHWYARDINAPDDLTMYDRIEVVRGATGLLEGAGDPSATVNLIRKRPFETRQGFVDAQATSYGEVTGTVDWSTPVNAAGTVRARIVATGKTGDGYRDGTDTTYGMVYGTLDADLSDSTTASIGFAYSAEDIDGYAWGGLPTRRDGSFFGFYDGKTSPSLSWEYSDRRQTVGFVEIDHRFDSGWSLRGAGRASKGDTDMLSSYLWWNGDDLTRSGGLFDYDNDSYALDVQASGPVRLFGREHELVFGANGNRDFTAYYASDAYDLVIPDPRHLGRPNGPKPPSTATYAWTEYTQTQAGLYGAGRFSIADPLTAILGGRVSWYDSVTWGGYDDSSYSANGEFTPYAGLVYDVNDRVMVYASYTEIFRPQSEVTPSGGQLDPATGKNYELGVKTKWFDGALEASLAVYQSEQTGLPDQVFDKPCPPGYFSCYEPAGEIRTRGVDVEVAGAVTDRWNVFLGYTYADPEYVEGENAGEPFNTAKYPRNMGKLFTTYDLGGRFEGLTLGGGMRVQSDIHAEGLSWPDNTPFKIKQGGYAVFDAMARYQVDDRTSLQVNVDNLLDREYYTAIADTGYGNFMASGLTATVALRRDF